MYLWILYVGSSRGLWHVAGPQSCGPVKQISCHKVVLIFISFLFFKFWFAYVCIKILAKMYLNLKRWQILLVFFPLWLPTFSVIDQHRPHLFTCLLIWMKCHPNLLNLTSKWPAGESKLCVTTSSHGTVSFCSSLSSAVPLIYLETVVLRNDFTNQFERERCPWTPAV